MRRGTSLRSLVRRTAVTGFAALFACAAFGVAQASAGVARVKPTINTYKSWDGSQEVVSFGCPNTTTYGQVITVPAGKSKLDKFTFSWINSSTGSMKVRGEVYAWDGVKATGSALFESAPRFVSFGDSLFHFETFKPGGVPVTAGQQYVIFGSIDKNFEQCKNNYILGWAAVADTAYTGGTFVYQNNGGDETQWTTTAWNTFGIDLAFKAFLS
jgi:hypothetical protein